jgi:hypothetical protein
LSVQVKDILAENDEGKMPLEAFIQTFVEKHKTALTLEQIKLDLTELVAISEDETEVCFFIHRFIL